MSTTPYAHASDAVPPVQVHRGRGPLVLGMPHTGMHLPPDAWAALNGNGRLLRDTDWHVDRLYADLVPDVTIVRATFHRYVIDANRDPSGASLYPGANTTELVPSIDFDGAPIRDVPPDGREIAARLDGYHAPYHAALAAELHRVRAAHGAAILFDCHSIRSHIPFLFGGELPHLNIGTADGASCVPEVEALVASHAATAAPLTVVRNGRFKGGWTTRHYGRPAEGWHAIQLEIAQRTYLQAEEAPFRYDTEAAAALRIHLRATLLALAALAPRLATSASRTP
jgi:formiminoglutamase